MLQSREWGWHFHNGSTSTWNAWFGKHCSNNLNKITDWLIFIRIKKLYCSLLFFGGLFLWRRKKLKFIKNKTPCTSSIFASWLLFWSQEKYRYGIPCKALYCVNLFYPNHMNLWPLGTLWWPLELWDKFCSLKVNKSTKLMLWMSGLQVYCPIYIFNEFIMGNPIGAN